MMPTIQIRSSSPFIFCEAQAHERTFLLPTDRVENLTRSLPAVRQGSPHQLHGPRNVSAVRELPDGRADRCDGAVLSAARAGVRRLLPGAAEGIRPARTYLHRVRLLLVLLDLLGRACAALLRNDQGAPCARRQ